MGIKGIIFMLIALCGVIINFFPHKIAASIMHIENAEEDSLLKIKLVGLALVLVGITLLMIIGK